MNIVPFLISSFFKIIFSIFILFMTGVFLKLSQKIYYEGRLKSLWDKYHASTTSHPSLKFDTSVSPSVCKTAAHCCLIEKFSNGPLVLLPRFSHSCYKPLVRNSCGVRGIILMLNPFHHLQIRNSSKKPIKSTFKCCFSD
jgi:hypothetical protein